MQKVVILVFVFGLLYAPCLSAAQSSDGRTQAVGIANALMAAGIAVKAQCDAINTLSTQYTQLALGTTLGALPTAPFNTDGSLGTADVSSNVAHPIDVRVLQTAGITMNRAISANDLASLLTYLQGVAATCAGTAVSANGAAPQLLAKITGN